MDGFVEVSIVDWPDQYNPGIDTHGIHVDFVHIGPTDRGTHIYFFRIDRRKIELITWKYPVISYFLGNYKDLSESNHIFKKYAFYADVERRNASGGTSKVSIPIFALQHGDKLPAGFRPRVVMMGDTDIPKLGDIDEIFRSVNISNIL